MPDDSEDEDVPNEVLTALTGFRAQTFDNLAADALTILSIQLITLPLSVSGLSLLFQLDIGDVRPMNNSSASAYIQDENDLEMLYTSLMIVFFVFTVAIGLAVDSYREARSKSYNTYNLLRNLHHSEIGEEQDFSHLNQLLQTSAINVYDKYQLTTELVDKIFTKFTSNIESSEKDQLLTEFGHDFSDEARLRLQLIFSLFLTFIALILFLRALFTPLFDQTNLMILLIIVLILLGLLYAYLGRVIFPAIGVFIRSPIKYSLVLLFTLYGVAYTLYLTGKSCVLYTISQGRDFTIGIVLIACYFFSLLTGTLLNYSLFQGNSYAMLVVVSLLIGLLGIGYLILWRLEK